MHRGSMSISLASDKVHYACTKTDINDWSHLLEKKFKKHENVVNLAMLGRINITTQLSEDYKIKQNVKRNREIFSKIITLGFFGKYELPLHGNYER